MVNMAIIADDLTGAADTGVQFGPYTNNTILISYDKLLSGSLKDFGLPIQALAVYTNSRSLKTGLAKERLSRVARKVFALRPKRVYKKIDSCLRGNVGAEVDAITDEMGYDLSFIAPALPEMGRTTLHDIHLVEGVPLDQTEISRDPVNPVSESRLSRAVSSGSHYEVGHVDFRFVDGSEEGLTAEIDRLVHCGAKHLVFDAINQIHLNKIAHLGLVWPKKVLLVGSAGLAKSLGRSFSKRPVIREYDRMALPEGNHLLVCGTASERTNMQISVLTETYPYEVIFLRPDLLADPGRREELLMYVPLAHSILSKKSLVIRIGHAETQKIQMTVITKPWPPEQIVKGLGLFVSMVLIRVKPASLFLTGGDTATEVLESIGIKALRLFGEIAPGMVYGMVKGETAEGLSIVTKAGAFGNDRTLIALHEYWENKKHGVPK